MQRASVRATRLHHAVLQPRCDPQLLLCTQHQAGPVLHWNATLHPIVPQQAVQRAQRQCRGAAAAVSKGDRGGRGTC